MPIFFSLQIRPKFRWIKLCDKPSFKCIESPTIGSFLFGIPFASVPFLLVFMAIYHSNPGWFSEWHRTGNLWALPLVLALLLCVPTAFFLVGLWCMFGSRGTNFDKQEGTIRDWWQLLFVNRERKFQISDFDRVETAWGSGGLFSGPSHYVCLSGPTKPVLRINTSGDREETETLATELARFLMIELRLKE
jgi:hypothetical protein